MNDVLVLGEILVDLAPLRRGAFVEGIQFEARRGGAPANVAAGVAKRGGRAAMAGVVGDDPFGRLAVRSLEADGVDCGRVRRTPDARTGLCFIHLDESGERRFVYGGGDANAELGAEALPIPDARVVVFSRDGLRSERSTAMVDQLLATPATRCFDPGGWPGHYGDPTAATRRLRERLPSCDVVKCSEEETPVVADETDPVRAARALVERGVGLALVTLGADGVVWARGDRSGRLPAPRVEVVDTTGAGDAFMAALTLGLARAGGIPEDLQALLLEACAAGAEAVGRLGA